MFGYLVALKHSRWSVDARLQLRCGCSPTSDEAQRELAEHAPEERMTAFEFVGVGHLTTADAYLAAQAAARAREDRQLAREALHIATGNDREGNHARHRRTRPVLSGPVRPGPARPATEPGEFERFLTAREVAERLRIALCTVLRYFEDGVLPGRRLRAGRFHPVRFRGSEIEAALDFRNSRAGESTPGQARTGEIKRTSAG